MHRVILAAVIVLLVAAAVAWGPGLLQEPAASTAPSPAPSEAPPSPSPTAIPSPAPTARPTATPAPSPTVAPTAFVFTSNDGYSMTIPAGWTATAVGPNDVGLLLGLLGASNPDLASLVRNILDLTHARASMVGGDLRDASAAVPPNVTVLIQPSAGLPLGLVGTVVEQVVNRIPGITGSAGKATVSLPAGDAIRLDYQVRPSSGGAPISLRTFAVVSGSQTFLVTFGAGSDRFSNLQPTFDEMINSLRLGV
jgi:hypothetical protein